MKSNRVIYVLCAIVMMANSSFSILAPFYPQEAEAREVDEIVVGLIFSLYSFAFVVTSLIFGSYLAILGRRRTLLFGNLALVVSLLGFGVLNWITDFTTFVAMSFFFRFIGGIGSAAINVSCYAMIALEYPENLTQKIGMLEACGGSGFFFGPIMGGILYGVGGYPTPFIVLTGLFAIMLPVF